MKTYHVSGGQSEPLIECHSLMTEDKAQADWFFNEIVETEEWVQMTVYSGSEVKSSVYSCR